MVLEEISDAGLLSWNVLTFSLLFETVTDCFIDFPSDPFNHVIQKYERNIPQGALWNYTADSESEQMWLSGG